MAPQEAEQLHVMLAAEGQGSSHAKRVSTLLPGPAHSDRAGWRAINELAASEHR